MANGTFRAGDRQSSYTVASGTNTDHIVKVALVDSAGADASANSSLPAGTNTIGVVGSPVANVVVTPTLDTNIYASGDVLFDTTAITGALRTSGGCALLQSVTVADKDDQKPAMKLVFLRSNVSLGTFNVGPAISDANALEIVGVVEIASGDYTDLGGVSVANVANIGRVVHATTGTTLYVAAFLTAGTPTHTASGVQLTFGLLQA